MSINAKIKSLAFHLTLRLFNYGNDKFFKQNLNAQTHAHKTQNFRPSMDREKPPRGKTLAKFAFVLLALLMRELHENIKYIKVLISVYLFGCTIHCTFQLYKTINNFLRRQPVVVLYSYPCSLFKSTPCNFLCLSHRRQLGNMSRFSVDSIKGIITLESLRWNC